MDLHRPLSFADLLRAAQAQADGKRWITVHPNGPGTRGTPVLLQPAGKKGAYHVVGGAGGRLNMLHLTGVKDPGEYAEHVKKKAADRRAIDQARKVQDKANGLDKVKAGHAAALQQDWHAAQAAHVRLVATELGWSDEQIAGPAPTGESGPTPADARASAKHMHELLVDAKAVGDAGRRRLIVAADHNTRAALGESEVHADRAATPGYATHYRQVVADQEEDIAQEAGALKESRKKGGGGQESTPAKSGDDQLAHQVGQASGEKQNMGGSKGEPTPAGSAGSKPADPDKGGQSSSKVGGNGRSLATPSAESAVRILRSERAMLAAHRRYKDGMAKLKRAADEDEAKGAYVLATNPAPAGTAAQDEADLKADIEYGMRCARTRAFLDEVGQVDGYRETLGRHIGAGAHHAMNEVAVGVAGYGFLGRDTLDVLGIAGAADALAARLHADHTPEQLAEMSDALGKYHLDHYTARSKEALDEAQTLRAEADAIHVEPGPDDTGHDLARLQEMVSRKKEALNAANRALGTALGEMEAHAALVVAMQSAGKAAGTPIAMGRVRDIDAITRLRAIGLEKGDYKIERADGQVITTITPEGLLRLTQPIDASHMQRVRDSVAIMNGEHDDEAFWPAGTANRPDMAAGAAALKAGVAPQLAEAFQPAADADLAEALRHHIGSRMADGDAPADIVSDLHTQAYADRVPAGRQAEYSQALSQLVPISDADGKMVDPNSRRQAFEEMASGWAKARHGDDARFAPIHAQRFDVGDTAVEATHRALCAHPAAIAAFRPIADLTPQDTATLRAHFAEHFAKADDTTRQLKTEQAQHAAREPVKEAPDMFGEMATTPEWSAWSNRREQLDQQLAEKGLDWNRYATLMGGPAEALGAMQDHIRGRFAQAFHAEHNKLAPDAPLKLGRTSLRENLRHLDAVDPQARAKRLKEHAELVDSLRARAGGRYAAGSVADRLDGQRERNAALEQSQMGFFSADEEPAAEEGKAARPLAADERHTLGTAAEQQLGGLVSQLAPNFDPKKPTGLWQPGMTGKYAPQQRAVKLIEKNKRMSLAQGVGSGKSAMILNSFGHLQQTGQAKRGLIVVPSIVQDQFSGEALRYLKPGTFRWHCAPGCSREERLAAYRNPDIHFSVVTHQGLRDDMLHLGATAAGIEPKAMAEQLAGMSEDERIAWARKTMADAGMSHDFMAVDEGHQLLNRAGKEDSGMANVLQAMGQHTPYYVSASADPLKNDLSELFDHLRMMDRSRFTDREAFMRRYGVNTPATKEALRREIAPYIYPGRIETGIHNVQRREVPVQLSAGQHAALAELEGHVKALRTAQLDGRVDVDAARALVPDAFEGLGDDATPEVLQTVAAKVTDDLALTRETAIRNIIDAHPENAKVDAIVAAAHERRGKPGVIFARSRKAVAMLTKRLQDEGHRAISLTGADSAKQKAAKRLAFHPEAGGQASADILVCSDAGAVGMNAQRGAWLAQHNTPVTATVHAQRNGRIERLGQKNKDIELLDFVADHAQEQADRRRLKTKYGLRDIVTNPYEGLDDTGFASYLLAARRGRLAEAQAVAGEGGKPANDAGSRPRAA